MGLALFIFGIGDEPYLGSGDLFAAGFCTNSSF